MEPAQLGVPERELPFVHAIDHMFWVLYPSWGPLPTAVILQLVDLIYLLRAKLCRAGLRIHPDAKHPSSDTPDLVHTDRSRSKEKETCSQMADSASAARELGAGGSSGPTYCDAGSHLALGCASRVYAKIRATDPHLSYELIAVDEGGLWLPPYVVNQIVKDTSCEPKKLEAEGMIPAMPKPRWPAEGISAEWMDRAAARMFYGENRKHNVRSARYRLNKKDLRPYVHMYPKELCKSKESEGLCTAKAFGKKKSHFRTPQLVRRLSGSLVGRCNLALRCMPPI
eukprot:m.123532 g.123532  ORF g.123532 m.123532 type:complete len:283 (+) comp13464_c0_seq3:258-1106(+)